MAFDGLLDILKKAQARYPGFSKKFTEAEALGRWNQAVGPVIAKHTRAIRVENGTLWVEVSHPIWKTELHHRKRQILDILNGGKAASGKTPGMEPAKDVLKDILFLDPRSPSRA